eukprot:scaffold35432_cov27-Tisochrysis_lutea.AAC.2
MARMTTAAPSGLAACEGTGAHEWAIARGTPTAPRPLSPVLRFEGAGALLSVITGRSAISSSASRRVISAVKR